MSVENLLGEDEDYAYDLSRSEFEEVCETIFARLIPPVQEALNDARMIEEDIDDVVLVGGSTRIPAA